MTHYISTLALGLVMMIGAITIRFITVRCLNAIHDSWFIYDSWFISALTPGPESPCQMYRDDMQQIKGEASLHHPHLTLVLVRQDISRGDLYNAVTVSSKCTFVMPLFMTAAPQPLVLDAGVTWGEVSRYIWAEFTLVLASVRTILCQGCTWSLSWNEHLVSEGQKPGLVFEAAVSYNHDHHQFVRLAGV